MIDAMIPPPLFVARLKGPGCQSKLATMPWNRRLTDQDRIKIERVFAGISPYELWLRLTQLPVNDLLSLVDADSAVREAALLKLGEGREGTPEEGRAALRAPANGAEPPKRH